MGLATSKDQNPWMFSEISHRKLDVSACHVLLHNTFAVIWGLTTKQKPIKILWIYSREIHKILMPYSPVFHGQN